MCFDVSMPIRLICSTDGLLCLRSRDRWQTRQNPRTFVHGGRELRWPQMIRFEQPNHTRIQRLMSLPPPSSCSLMNYPGSYVRDVKTKASSSIPPWQVTLGYIGAQCGRQEAWTTVDLALIRGLVPHDQGSS